MNKILCLDQARKCGWSLYDYEKKELLACGSFDYSAKKYTFAKSVLYIEKELEKLLSELRPSAVFIEDIQMRVNPRAYKALAQLQGVLINCLEKHELLYDTVYPSQWQGYIKKSSGICVDDSKSVKGSKQLSLAFVKQKFGIDTKDDNLSDAVCIGWYAVNNIDMYTKE